MFCRSCGTELAQGAIACTKCGLAPFNGTKFCPSCGKETNPEAIMCVSCGVGLRKSAGAAPRTTSNAGPSSGGVGVAQDVNKTAVGLCGIFLGGLGVHKFMLGYPKEGKIMLAVSCLTLGIGAPLMVLVGFIEGIMYLTKSDEDFAETYIHNQKPWF